MIRTLKCLSVLLSYPTEELVVAAPDIRHALSEEGLVPKSELGPLLKLADGFATGDIYDLQERYGLLFDRTRSLSLNLFEHVHGESRERGQAMVDLKEHYARHGLELGTSEMPDFLPLFLEFLSTRPLPEARSLLGQPLHVLTALRERLAKRKSAYAAAFAALEAIAEADAGDGTETTLADLPDDDPTDLEALDRAWEDEPVTFGPGAAGGVSPGGGCPAVRDTLARMDEPGPALTRPDVAGATPTHPLPEGEGNNGPVPSNPLPLGEGGPPKAGRVRASAVADRHNPSNTPL